MCLDGVTGEVAFVPFHNPFADPRGSAGERRARYVHRGRRSRDGASGGGAGSSAGHAAAPPPVTPSSGAILLHLTPLVHYPLLVTALQLCGAYRCRPRDGALQCSRRFLGFDDLNELQSWMLLQIREALNEPRLMIVKAERDS